jgi:hypothetical protein
MDRIINISCYLIVMIPLGLNYESVKWYFGGGLWFVLITAVYLVSSFLILQYLIKWLISKVYSHE